MKHIKTIDELLVEAKKQKLEPLPMDQVYIVYAHAGRNNGWAIVGAISKSEARKAARNSGWLDLGTVDNAITFKEFADGQYDTPEAGMQELIASKEWPTKINQVTELEWGT